VFRFGKGYVRKPMFKLLPKNNTPFDLKDLSNVKFFKEVTFKMVILNWSLLRSKGEFRRLQEFSSTITWKYQVLFKY